MKALTKTYHLFRYGLFRRSIRFYPTFDQVPNSSAKPSYTLIFLHGIAADSKTWSKTLKSIKKDPFFANFRLIALDLPGFGKAPSPSFLNYDYKTYQNALTKTLKKLKITTNFTLIGHSMGSLISANYSTIKSPFKTQIKHLVLVSPPVLLPKETANLPDKFYQISYSSIHDLLKKPPLAKIAELVDKFTSFNAKSAKSKPFAKSMDNIILNKKNYQTFKNLKVKTDLIHGNLDPLVIKSNLKALTSNSNIKLTSCLSGHDISPAKQTKIIQIIKRELKSILN